MNRAAKILVVGAGALGQVYGAHLARGVAEVHVLVRPERAAAARAGLSLWRIRRGRAPQQQEFKPRGTITTASEAGETAWDAVLLCVASDALRGEWLAPLTEATAPATIVSIGQAAGDHGLVQRVAGAARTISAVPAVFAWHGPLTDELPSAGTGYWLPRGAKLLVGGEQTRAEEIIAALRAGGLRARWSSDAILRGALMAARTTPYVAALESVGWSFAALRRDPLLPVAARAAREAEAATRAQLDEAPRKPKPPTPARARMALRLLPAMAPFDAERYAARPFSKVGEQTGLMLAEWIHLARTHSLEHTALQQVQLASRMASARDTPPASSLG
jgi:ketopantoate reductase